MLDFALQSLLVVLLILVNGFFAAAEMAVMTSSRPRLARLAAQGSPGARAALALADNPEGLLSTLQIGVTLLTILSGAYGEASLARYVTTLLEGVPALAPHAKALGFGLVVAAITYVSLILGELVPKRLAIARPEAVAVVLARPMLVVLRLAAPLAWVLSASTRAVLRLLGVGGADQSRVTQEEILLLVRQAASTGVLEDAERDMLERVVRLNDRTAGSLMTHRSRLVVLDMEEPGRMRDTVAAAPFNRFPVVRGGLEHLLGVVEAKDLIGLDLASRPQALLTRLVQPPHVFETASTLGLMEELKNSRQSMAVVVDEFGDVQGVVTLTDVLAAVAGDLVRSASWEEPRIVRRKDGSWLVDATTPVADVFTLMDLPVPEGGFTTLAGYVLARLGSIPAIADSFVDRGWRFEVVDMDGNRVDRVLIQRAAPGDVDHTGDEE